MSTANVKQAAYCKHSFVTLIRLDEPRRLFDQIRRTVEKITSKKIKVNVTQYQTTTHISITLLFEYRKRL